MNSRFASLLFQRLPYILILFLFFCLVPWQNLELLSLEFWFVIGITGLFTFQIIKSNQRIWGLIVTLFSFYCIWMTLAFLSDLNKSGDATGDFVLYGSILLIAIFVVDIWLILVNPKKLKKETQILGS